MELHKVNLFLMELWASLLTGIKVVLMSRRTKLEYIIKKNSSDVKCLIIGNGPSLNKEVLGQRAFFESTTSICVNYFPLSDEYVQIQPNAIVLHAPEFWIENVKEEDLLGRQKLFNALIDKTNWELVLYAPIKAKKSKNLIDNILINKHIIISFYNDAPVEGLSIANSIFFNFGLGMPRPHNVVIPALIIAIRQHFKEIYLTGVDHSWLNEISVDEENRVLVGQYHFYDDGNVKPAPMNKVGRQKTRNLAEVLEKFIYTFKSYYVINEYAKNKKIKIYNATKGSFIDAFDRIDLNKLKL